MIEGTRILPLGIERTKAGQDQEMTSLSIKVVVRRRKVRLRGKLYRKGASHILAVCSLGEVRRCSKGGKHQLDPIKLTCEIRGHSRTKPYAPSPRPLW
jgi:hypothetical protein